MPKLPFVGSYGSKLHGSFRDVAGGPACSSKHAGALHELYARSRVGSGNGSSGPSNVIDTETRESSSEDEQPVVKKVTPNSNNDNNNTMLLLTSAVRVINPSSRRSTLACAT